MSQTPYVRVNAKREMEQSTFVVFKDKDGHVGTIVVDKAKPSVEDVQKAVAARKSK